MVAVVLLLRVCEPARRVPFSHNAYTFPRIGFPRGRFIDTNDARVPADRLITLSGKSSANFLNIHSVRVRLSRPFSPLETSPFARAWPAK